VDLKNALKIIKQYYEASPAKFSMLVTGAVMICIVMAHSFSSKDAHASSAEHTVSNNSSHLSHLGDYLPEDKILVPLEIVNAEAIASLINSEGKVDLYKADDTHRKTKIIDNLKIVKTGEDGQFSAIVGEDENEIIPLLQQPLFAVVKAKTKRKKNNINHRKAIRKSQWIKIEGEDL